MRHNLEALSTVSSLGCILSRFVPNVACTPYDVVVSSCSCNVCGWYSTGSSIYSVCISLISVSVFLLGSFLLHFVSLVDPCRRESVHFTYVFGALALLVVMHFRLCFYLSRYYVNYLLVRMPTLVMSTVSILIVKSHPG